MSNLSFFRLRRYWGAYSTLLFTFSCVARCICFNFKCKRTNRNDQFFLFFVVKLELIQSEFAYIYNFRPFAAPGKCRPLRPATPLLPRMTQLQYIEDSESVLDGSRNRLRAVQWTVIATDRELQRNGSSANPKQHGLFSQLSATLHHCCSG